VAPSQAKGWVPWPGGRHRAGLVTGMGMTAAAADVGRGHGVGSGGGELIFFKCGRYCVACRERTCRGRCEILANVDYGPVHLSVQMYQAKFLDSVYIPQCRY
jgi:hypothetical protein